MEDIYSLLNSEIPNDCYVVTDVDTDIDIAGPKYWKIIAPESYDLEAVIALNLATAATVEIFKDPTLTGAGTDLTPQPLNQNASFTPSATISKDPTNSADGTLVYATRAQAGVELLLPKIIFDRGKTYQVKVTTDADNNSGYIRVVAKETN